MKIQKLLHNIVFQVSSEGRFLLRGEPTDGKTTFLRKLCRDWASLHTVDEEAELEQKLSEFSLVLPVILRAVQPDTDLSDTVQRQTGISDTDIHTMMYILNTEPNKVMFIFDGLDEFNLETNKDITEIMEKREYKKSTCIITTRPEAADKVKHWTHVIYKQPELRGFSKENIKKFIEKFFRSHEEGVKIADELYSVVYPPFDYKHDFNLNPLREIDELQKLAGNPGRLGMLCSIYSYNQEIVTNTAKLYEEFIIIILSKWEEKQNKKPTPKNRILDKYKDVLYQFGKLAYKQEDNGDLKLTFTMEDLEKCISPELYNCGFMYKSHPLHRFEDCQVGFIHKSVKEYMAAYYISHEETGQELDRILKDLITKETIKNEEYVASVLKFAIYCGLSKEQIQHAIDYCIHNAYNKTGISSGLLKLLEHYKIPLNHEPFFLGSDDDGDFNWFVQLPACMIITKLSESTFRSRRRGIKQSDDQKSWILTWPSDTKIIAIVDHVPDDKDDWDWDPGDDEITEDMTEDDIMIMFHLHKSPLLITGESQNVTHLFFITTENTQVHVSSVCKNVTNVYLHGKLHSQAKWLNNLLLNVPKCTKLFMKSCGLSAEDINDLCEQTKGLDLNIEILNLENNDVITEGPDDLERFVRQCPRLRKLYLTSENMKETQHEDLVMELYERIEKGLLLFIDDKDGDDGDTDDDDDDDDDNDDDDDDNDDDDGEEVVTPGAVGGTEDSTNTENSDIRNDKPDKTEDTVRDQKEEFNKKGKKKKKCVLM